MFTQYRTRKIIRLQDHDYSKDGWYFVTVCVGNRTKFFGDIHNGIMCVNRLGSIAYRQWEWLFQQYKYIRSEGFVVMPNHIHGILVIDRELYNIQCDGRSRRGESRLTPTNTNRDHIKSLFELVGAFKTTSSKLIHRTGFPQFQWQRSFYEHIIRDEKSFRNIYSYIINNPTLWNRDRNNQ